MVSKEKHRFKYLREAPWSFTRSDSEAGAATFMEQVQALPFDDHDDLTKSIVQRLGGFITARGQGGELHPDHAEAVRVMRLATIHEGAGEGIHRGTTHEHGRAPSSSTAHLKHSVRQRSSVRRIKAFRTKWGARAHAVLRHDWRVWKRICQGRAECRWVPKKMSEKAVFDRLYRQDEMASEDWSAIAEHKEDTRPVVHEAADRRTTIENEYLRAQVQPGSHYALPRPEVPADVPAAPEVPEPAGNMYFRGLESPARKVTSEDYACRRCRRYSGGAGSIGNRDPSREGVRPGHGARWGA